MRLKSYIFIMAPILFSSCSSILLPIEKPMVQIPSNHEIITDSINLVNLNWIDFFSDKNLKELIQEGINNNLDVQNAMLNIDIAAANKQFIRGLQSPDVSAGTSAGVYKFGDYTQEWAGNKTTEMLPGRIIPQHLPNYNVGFTSSWEVDVWGKIKMMSKAAQARFLSSFEAKKWLQINLIYFIASNYYELVNIEKQIDIINQNIDVQKKTLEIIKTLKQFGRSTEFAVTQFESQILNATVESKELKQAIIERENEINLILSRYPKSITGNKLTFNDSIYGFFKSGLPFYMLENRPDVKRAENELIASRFDAQIAKKAFYPSFNITGGLGLNGFSPSLLFTIPSAAYNILGGLTAPVFNRNALKAAFKTASASQIIALNNYQQTIINAFSEVYTQHRILQNLLEAYKLKKEEVSTLENSMENIELLFTTNRVDYIEVLLLQQNILKAKLELQNLQNRQNQVALNLFKSLGGGQ